MCFFSSSPPAVTPAPVITPAAVDTQAAATENTARQNDALRQGIRATQAAGYQGGGTDFEPSTNNQGDLLTPKTNKLTAVS